MTPPFEFPHGQTWMHTVWQMLANVVSDVSTEHVFWMNQKTQAENRQPYQASTVCSAATWFASGAIFVLVPMTWQGPGMGTWQQHYALCVATVVDTLLLDWHCLAIECRVQNREAMETQPGSAK